MGPAEGSTAPGRVPQIRASIAEGTRSVALALNVKDGSASLTLRATADPSLVAARLRQALAEYDLDLGELQMNGLSQPLAPNSIRGGNNGHSRR